MSSLLPTESDDFAVTTQFYISAEVWNASVPVITARLRAVEDVVSQGYEAAQQAGTAMAQAIIQDSVTPQLVAVGETIADFDDQLALAEDRLAALNNGGVVAANVTITPVAGLTADDAQEAFDAIGAVLSGLKALATRDTVGTAQIDDLAITFGKIAAAAIASQAEAQAGTATTKLMTPQRVNQAIQSLSPKPGLVPIGSRIVVSSAVSSIDFTLPSGYKEFLLRFWNLNVFQSGARFAIRTSADGVNFNNDSSAYQSYQLELRSNVSAAVNSGTRTSAAMFLTISNTPYDPPPTQNSGHIRILNAKEEAETAIICESIFRIDSSTVVPVFGGGNLNSKEITSAIRLLAITTQITSGSAQLYGVPN